MNYLRAFALIFVVLPGAGLQAAENRPPGYVEIDFRQPSSRPLPALRDLAGAERLDRIRLKLEPD
jgi:hypothetical protein